MRPELTKGSALARPADPYIRQIEQLIQAHEPSSNMAGFWGILEHDAENMAHLFGDLIDDLVEHQDWDFNKEMEWTTNDQTTQALLKEAWAILADELQGEFTEEHQDVIDETQVEKWLLSKDTHVMTLSYRSGHILSTSEGFPEAIIQRIKQESPCYKVDGTDD